MSTGPRRLGKYELQKRLAHGGMGEVWKSHDTQLNRYVAIKLLRTDVQDNPEFATRFEQEARFIAALRHPNIVQIHDFSISQPPESEIPTAYIVMDYIEGQTLSDYIRSTSRKGNFPPASDIVYIFTAISSALDYAHREGKIHRDIKPANILLDQRLPTARSMGEPTLIDFGIARLQGVATGTVVGSLLGTPLYISPEQAQGLHGDHRSDLYSLGIILYEMMTGVTPFRGETTMAIIMQHLNDAPIPPERLNPAISPELSAVILKSIAKKPDDRFSTASAMTIELAKALQVPIPTRLLPSSPSQRLSPPSQNRPHSSPGLTPSFYTPAEVQAPIQSPSTNPVTPPDLFLNPVSLPQPANQHYSYPPPVAQPAGQLPFPTQQKTPRKRLKLLLIFALVTLLVLAGAGLGIPFLLPHPEQPTPSAQPAVVGQLQFSHSPQAASGTYNQLQITLHNIPAPPAGHVYYGWIEILQNETVAPHWPLTFQNGTIQQTVTYNKNLLIPDALFVITAENATSTPTVAQISPRYFYARITSSSSQTFAIQRCPSDPSSQVCSG